MIKYRYTKLQLQTIAVCSQIALHKLHWEESDEISKIIDIIHLRLTLKENLDFLSRPDIDEGIKKITDYETCVQWANEILELATKKYSNAIKQHEIKREKRILEARTETENS